MPFTICLYRQKRLIEEMRMKIILLRSLLLALTTTVAIAAPYCAVFAWENSVITLTTKNVSKLLELTANVSQINKKTRLLQVQDHIVL